jgi:hypothetical protein
LTGTRFLPASAPNVLRRRSVAGAGTLRTSFRDLRSHRSAAKEIASATDTVLNIGRHFFTAGLCPFRGALLSFMQVLSWKQLAGMKKPAPLRAAGDGVSQRNEASDQASPPAHTRSVQQGQLQQEKTGLRRACDMTNVRIELAVRGVKHIVLIQGAATERLKRCSKRETKTQMCTLASARRAKVKMRRTGLPRIIFCGSTMRAAKERLFLE